MEDQFRSLAQRILDVLPGECWGQPRDINNRGQWNETYRKRVLALRRAGHSPDMTIKDHNQTTDIKE